MTTRLIRPGIAALLVLAIATLAPLASAAGIDGGVIGTSCIGQRVDSGDPYTSYCDGAHYTDGSLDCLGRHYDNGTCTT